MRFVAPLDDVFHGLAATRVLRILSLFPAKEFTGREMAVEASLAPSNAIAELNRLLEQGFVRRRVAGRSQLWSLDPDHTLGRRLRELFEFEYGLSQDLRSRIAKAARRIPGLQRVVLFGSVARKEERPASDVDVLLLVTRQSDKKQAMAVMADLRRELRHRFGNRLQPILYSHAEWKRGKGRELVRSIEQEGQIVWERST